MIICEPYLFVIHFIHRFTLKHYIIDITIHIQCTFAHRTHRLDCQVYFSVGELGIERISMMVIWSLYAFFSNLLIKLCSVVVCGMLYQVCMLLFVVCHVRYTRPLCKNNIENGILTEKKRLAEKL